MGLQLNTYRIHSHLLTIEFGDKVLGHVSKVDGGGWVYVSGNRYSIEFSTEKEAIEQLATYCLTSEFDNKAMQQGLITQDEKFVKGFFDQEFNKDIKKIKGK